MPRGDDRIRRFYLFRAVTSFSLWIPFWTLWVYKNLDSVFLMTVVDAAFWVTMIAFQIPAGLLGDKYGRKAVLFAGEITYAVGVFSFGMSTGFSQYLFSNIVWAIGVCFIVSGDTPYVYDLLLEFRRSGEFTKVMGTANAVMYVMNAVAVVVGGLIVQETDHLEYTLLIASVIGFMGSFTILALKEPKVDKQEMASYRTQFKAGIKRILWSRPILILVLFQIVVEIGIYVMAVFRSVYMNDYLDLSYLEIGLFFSSFAIVGGIVTRKADKVDETLGERRALFFMYAAIFGSFIVVFLVASPAAIITQYLIYMVAGLNYPIINGYINKRVDSSTRSTVMSIASFMFTGILTVVEVAAGWVATYWGLKTSLLILAVGTAPISIYLLVLWTRELDKESAARVKYQRVLKDMT